MTVRQRLSASLRQTTDQRFFPDYAIADYVSIFVLLLGKSSELGLLLWGNTQSDSASCGLASVAASVRGCSTCLGQFSLIAKLGPGQGERHRDDNRPLRPLLVTQVAGEKRLFVK